MDNFNSWDDNRVPEEDKQMEMVERGEKIVRIIAITGIIFAIIGMFLNGNILGAIISILISVGLLVGKNWVRILYIVLGSIGVFITFFGLIGLLSLGATGFVIILFLLLAVDVVFIILLIGNKSVLEYFEYKKCTCN